MRKLLIMATGLLLFSCNTKSTIKGTFIKTKENERGSAINILKKGLVEKINFGDKLCRFDYFGTTMSGEYTIDDNYVYIAVGGELGTLAFEIIDGQTLEGEGWASGTFKKN